MARRFDLKTEPETTIIDLGERSLPLTVRTNARARRMTLKIEPGGHALSLTVPPGLARHQVDGFMRRHHDWLLEKLDRFSNRGVIVENGSVLPVFGRKHEVRHSGALRGLTESFEADGKRFLNVSGPEERVGQRVADFLKREAKREITLRVRKHAAASAKRYKNISFKDTRSRWGSCSSTGNLSFSWRIAMAPMFVVDYLAAHEVAHLTEMNHGPHFWALCEKLCPKTEEARAWLKTEGSFLHAVRFDA